MEVHIINKRRKPKKLLVGTLILKNTTHRYLETKLKADVPEERKTDTMRHKNFLPGRQSIRIWSSKDEFMRSKTRATAELRSQAQSASLTSDSHMSGLDFWLVFAEVFRCSAVTPRCSVTNEDATLMAQRMKPVKTHSLAQTVYNQSSPAEAPNWGSSGTRRDAIWVFTFYS